MKPESKPRTTEPRKFYSRPRDESLEAYKDWINGIVRLLNPDAKSTMTEEKWQAKWREFWSKANEAEKE